MSETVRVLFVSDVVGRPGRRAVREIVPGLRERRGVDLVVANAENAAAGFGLTPALARDLLASGVDVLTSGNHVWDRKEILPFLDSDAPLLRPANYPPGAPGRGYLLHTLASGTKVGVLCLQGRVFMHESDCPFQRASAVVDVLRVQTPVIVVDFHAEATSEKVALGRYLDGRVSAVLGTHTHVQTADETILPGGTAYITDTGMTGPFDSVIGIETAAALGRFLNQVPRGFEVATGDVRLTGVLVEVNGESGRAERITRVSEPAAPDPGGREGE